MNVIFLKNYTIRNKLYYNHVINKIIINKLYKNDKVMPLHSEDGDNLRRGLISSLFIQNVEAL